MYRYLDNDKYEVRYTTNSVFVCTGCGNTYHSKTWVKNLISQESTQGKDQNDFVTTTVHRTVKLKKGVKVNCNKIDRETGQACNEPLRFKGWRVYLISKRKRKSKIHGDFEMISNDGVIKTVWKTTLKAREKTFRSLVDKYIGD